MRNCNVWYGMVNIGQFFWFTVGLLPGDVSLCSIPPGIVYDELQLYSQEARGNVQDKNFMSLSIARTVGNLQRALALVQSGSTQLTAVQLQQSLSQLIAVQQLLQLRVQWTPEQMKRQQSRLERQQARFQWQQTMLKQLRDE